MPPEEQPARAPAPAPPLTVHGLLHRLWSQAVDTPGYHKRDWKLLEAVLGGPAQETLHRPVSEAIPQKMWSLLP